MATIKAKDVKAGGVFLHPETKIPLRRVEPADFPLPEGLRDAVFAVDDEGGLYSIRAKAQVEQPWHVPLATKKDDDAFILVVTFERLHSEDDQILRDNFKAGRITADPAADFGLAAAHQLKLELQEAFEEGHMTGFFQSHRIIDAASYDTVAMGWPPRKDVQPGGGRG